FDLVATGAQSALEASVKFTDGNAINGDGTMTVSPTTVPAGSTGNSLTFTFTHVNGNDFSTGAAVTVDVPSGWTPAPQVSNSGKAGFVSATAVGGATLGTVSVTGNTITIPFSGGNGTGFSLSYAGGGTKVTAPSVAGPSTFTTKSKQAGGTLTALAAGSQP